MTIADSQDALPVVLDNPGRGRFELFVDDRVAGVVTYRTDEAADGTPVIVLDHTRVKSAFEGRGLGSKLARGAIALARARGGQVRVECPFLCGWLRRNPDLAVGVELDPHEDSDFAWAD